MACTSFNHSDESVITAVVESPLFKEVHCIEQPLLDLEWNAPTPSGFVKGEFACEALLRDLGLIIDDGILDGFYVAAPGIDLQEVHEVHRRARGFFGGLRQPSVVRDLIAAGKVARMWLVPDGTPVPKHALDMAAS